MIFLLSVYLSSNKSQYLKKEIEGSVSSSRIIKLSSTEKTSFSPVLNLSLRPKLLSE